MSLRVLSTGKLYHVVMVRSAVKKNRRKSQREAARLQKQADAILAMEEEEEIHFKRPETVPDTPRVSRTNSPDREEGEAKDFTAVLEMVKTVRDRLAALVLDNTNIRAACDDLRRQCHSQGVAFGDLFPASEAVAGRSRGKQSGYMGGDQTAPSDPTRVVRWWR